MTTHSVSPHRLRRRFAFRLVPDQDLMLVPDQDEYGIIEHLPSTIPPFWGRRRNPSRSTSGSPVTDDVIDGWFLKLAEEATVDGPTLSKRVLNEAKRIVRRLRRELPLDADIYPMDEGKVAIELFGDFGRGFLLVCEPGGSALCIVTVGGVSRRARYDSSTDLPDGFLHEGLKDMRPAP